MKPESNMWLHHMFSTQKMCVTQIVAYLNRYSEPGIQEYLIRKLKPLTMLESPHFILPQLVQTFCSRPTTLLGDYIIYILRFWNMHDYVACLIVAYGQQTAVEEWVVSEIYAISHNRGRFHRTRTYKRVLHKKIINNRTFCIKSKRRTKWLYNPCRRASIDRILLTFTSLVTTPFQDIFRALAEYRDHFFVPDKYIKPGAYSSHFLKSQRVLYDALEELCVFLKALPRGLRRSVFLLEMYILDFRVRGAVVHTPGRERIYGISLGQCVLLDSAENCPYLIAFLIEDVERGCVSGTKLQEAVKASCLIRDLFAGGVELTEVVAIAERILEQVKWVDKEDGQYGCVRRYVLKRSKDLKSEVVASRVVIAMRDVFRKAGLDIQLVPYEIYLVSPHAALIEYLEGTRSVHAIKKIIGKGKLLHDYFASSYADLKQATGNFLKSLVGYSLLSYFLALKDRHNGNILIDAAGRIIQIDYGFILGAHPGFYMVESAPFKLSREYVSLISMHEFKSLMVQGFLALRDNSDLLCRLCPNDEFRLRFRTDIPDSEIDTHVDYLVDWSIKSMRTGLYDSFQYFSHGYRV